MGGAVTALRVALLVCGVSAAAHAHGPPAEIAFWGGFPPDAARCQRVISRAASQCIARVAAARTGCLSGELAGTACDETELSADVAAARQRALDRVQRSCTVTQLQNLGYVDLSDAFRDVTDACRQIDTASTSAAFGPAMVGGTLSSVDELTGACVTAGARASSRLLRYSMRAYQQVLDRIAALNLSVAEKERLIAWADRRIASARASSRNEILLACGADDFSYTYRRSVDTFLDDVGTQAACMAQFVYVQDAIVCPTPTCGNGMQEPGEECDDGNEFDGDGCRGDCIKTECEVFANSYDLIQRAIFENHGCTNDACHGNAQTGGLDLRAEASYDALLDIASAVDPDRHRVEPGDAGLSVLFLKLAGKTLPDQYPTGATGVGAPMPSIGNGLSVDELEALRLWIYGAAPRHGAIKGVAELLNACGAEPQPIRIKPLDPPAPGVGVQLHMPPWTVDAHSEHEVCFASYYDVTDQVPEELRGPNDTFCYNTEQLRQDPLSHHLIISRYIGKFPVDDPGWGQLHCVGGPRDGEECVAGQVGICGEGGECATAPVIKVGCSGVGPPDTTQNSVNFAGAQQTNASKVFPDGAYRCVPLKGMVYWNSHAFNLTDRPGKLEAWVNFTFAQPDERKYFALGIFTLSSIFQMKVPACQQQEVCAHFQFPQGSHLFDLTSHTHQRGKRWRTFTGRFSCEGQTGPGGAAVACDPLSPTQCTAGNACTDPGGRAPMANLIYTNVLYNDPVELTFDPPLAFAGDADDLSLTYCALYDNGFTDPALMKRKSTSPITPFGTSTCQTASTCYAGKVCQPCSGATPEQRNTSCDSSPGAGDGLCDGCQLNGGVTTEDEMFLLLGSYYRK
ncbi:MAG: DUF4215 domain-containing protein, partial [Candidatus Binatia bacterium]